MPRLRSNEIPSGAFKRQSGLAPARWKGLAPTSSGSFPAAVWSSLSKMGEKIFIDSIGVEDALDVTMAQQTELDYLIYNDPLGYADLILNGDPERYLKNVTGNHGLED